MAIYERHQPEKSILYHAIIVGKPISVVGIGFEDGSDFDYNDASLLSG